MLGYLLLSLVFTYPLALHFGSATLGPHYADRLQNEWNLWWVQTAFARHMNPFHTDLLFYPQGTDLYFHALDLPLNVLVLPVAALFGLTAGYNSSVILALTLAGYAGWRLAAYVTGQPAAAFFGGIIIGFNPLTAEMIQGQTNIVNLGWCVLCLEFYWRAWADGRRRDALRAGLFFALAVLTVGYYEGYLLLAFVLDGLRRLWPALDRADPTPNPSPKGGGELDAPTADPSPEGGGELDAPTADPSPEGEGEMMAPPFRPSLVRGGKATSPVHSPSLFGGGKAASLVHLPSLFRGGVGGGVEAVRCLLLWGGGTAAVMIGPYLWGAWRSVASGQVAPFTEVDAGQPLHNSADLISLLLPSGHGWLLGAAAPWGAAVPPAIHDFLWLGPVTLGLAGLGWWAGRSSGSRYQVAGIRGPGSGGGENAESPTQDSSLFRIPHSAFRIPLGFWLALAAVGVVLALGPVLQVGGGPLGDGALPLPFSGLRLVPPFSLLRVPYRFMTLAWIGLGVAATGGVAALLTGARGRGRGVVAGGVLGLLILQMPLQIQPLRAATVPPSLAAVAADPAPGALIELPFTQHGGLDAARMLYQTAHGRPIAGGYLSRTVADPYVDACSPFAVLRAYPDVPARDIVTPTAVSLLPGILRGQGVGFLAVYKSRSADPANGDPLPSDQLGPLQRLAAGLAVPLADDATATTYRLHPAAAPPRYLQLGSGWHDPERRAGQPFRWLADAEADFCVFSPAAAPGRLTFQAAAFATPRRLEVWVGDRLLSAATVPADGLLHALTTPLLSWPAGPQSVVVRAPAAGASPAATGGSDARVLRVGLSDLAWQP